MLASLSAAYNSLNLPEELKSISASGGLNLYLSGGGFRGWGFALMDQHPEVRPYPIPIINGFSVPARTFHNTAAIIAVLDTASERQEPLTMHRVSKRRVSQIPAVANLVACVAEALPAIRDVFFCQGGVREGRLFSELEPQLRSQRPLSAATQGFAPQSRHGQVASSAVCSSTLLHVVAISGGPRLTDVASALANVMYRHCSLPKDVRAAAALQCPVTGELAGAHGLSHQDRAHLAIALCERHGGRKELDPANVQQYDRLMQLIVAGQRWWLRYLGRVAAFLGVVYPAGIPIDESGAPQTRVVIDGHSSSAEDGKISLSVSILDGALTDSLDDAIERVEKIGKKKQWLHGELGHKVDWKIRGTSV